MNKRYETIICGATFNGIGRAIAGTEDTLVVERGAIVGHDFIECLNPGKGWADMALTKRGGEFQEELKRRNVLTEQGGIHLPGVYPLLCQIIKHEKLEMLFLTEIINVEKEEDGYQVTLCNASGLQTVHTNTIIDTTSSGLSIAAKNRPVPLVKKINVYLDFADSDQTIPEQTTPGTEWVQGRFPAEVIFKLEIDPDDNWPQARDKLHKYWKQRPVDLQSWTLSTIAGEFETVMQETSAVLDEGWSWSRSAAYGNLLLAFDDAFKNVMNRGTTV